MKIVRFPLYFLGVALLTGAAVLALKFFGFEIVMKENGVVEWLEVLWLLLSSLFLFLAARRSIEYSGLFSVLWLLPVIAAIRELDGIFDKIFHGAWIIPAMFIAAIVFYRIFRSFNILKLQSLSFINTQQVVFLGVGFFIVVIFAQISGEQCVMRAVLQEHYHRYVGRFVEEFIEFLGYIILVIGSLECYIQTT